MLVLPVFLTRHSSIKVRRENDCKGKTQILKTRKNQLILLNFNDNNCCYRVRLGEMSVVVLIPVMTLNRSLVNVSRSQGSAFQL